MKSSKYEYGVLAGPRQKFGIGIRRTPDKEWEVLGGMYGYDSAELAKEAIQRHIEDDDWKPELVAM